MIDDDRLQLGVVRLIGDDAKIGAVVEHVAGDAAGEPAPHRDPDGRVEPAVLVQERQQVQARQLVGGDHELPAPQIPHVVQRRQRLSAEVHQAFRVLEQDLARIGEHAAPARAIEERLADLVLELADDLADRGLGAVERLGRLGEAALADDGDKRFELEEFHFAGAAGAAASLDV